LALAAAAGLYHLHYHAAYTLDDAYISFRYARHLARGAGLVWNAGEYVKGYSNTLYTLLMALPELAGRDPITLSKLLGYAAFLGSVLCGVRAYASAPATEPALRDRALWFALLCAASTSLAVHCVNGLETGFYAALLFAGVLRRVREQDAALPPWSALPLTAAVLSRPEGILIFAAVALHDLVWRSWQRRFRLQDLVFYLAAPLAYVLELWWSQRYYGAALPNTYYAKTSGTHGLSDTLLALWHGGAAQLRPSSYLQLGMAGTGLGLLGFGLALPALIARRFRRRSWALWAVIAAQLVFIVRAGDDWAPAFRFGVPLLLPLFMLLADSVGSVAALARRYERPVGYALAALLCLAILPQQLRDSRTIDKERFVNAANKLLQGAFFASLAEPGITLSSFDIGGQGYAAGGFDVLDTAGLTSRHTVGCRRGGARCARYAELVMPELVRLHSNRARDAFVSKTVTRRAPYLSLDGGKYLLQRALVFREALPTWLPEQALAGPQLLAADAPEAVLQDANARLTLYFRRPSGAPSSPLAERRLRWQSATGSIDAGATGSILRHLASDAWREGELFADLIDLRTPAAAGSYELQVVAEQTTPIARVDVVGPGAAAQSRAGALLESAQREPDHEKRLRMFSRAAALSVSAHAAYQQAAIAFARELRTQAIAEQPRDPLAALRTAQRAKRWLLRAFWECGHARRELRSELDANGALRDRLGIQLLGD